MGRVAGSGAVAFVETSGAARAAQTGLRPSRRYPEEERRYSWLGDYLARLEGKEARQEYYALLETEVVGASSVATSRTRSGTTEPTTGRRTSSSL